MGDLKDAWDDLRGKTARREAEENARRNQEQAMTDAAKQRTFAETEGQGIGSMGSILLGTDEEVEDPKVKTKSSFRL